MKLVHSLLAILAVSGAPAPALAQAPHGTELVTREGASVERIHMRDAIDAAWVVDVQTVLYRDASREHYLVTLRAPCRRLALQQPFSLAPSDSRELRATRNYELLPQAGAPCEVARIEQVGAERAREFRRASRRRTG